MKDNLFISVKDRPFLEITLSDSIEEAERKLKTLSITDGVILKIIVLGSRLFCKTVLSLQNDYIKSLKDRGIFEVFFDYRVQQDLFNSRILGSSKTRDFAAVLNFYLKQLDLSDLDTRDIFLAGQKILDEVSREL